MKTPDDALRDVASRLDKTWSQVVTGASWGSAFNLGSSGLTGRRLAEAWAEIHPIASRWEAWAATAGPGVRLDRRPALVHGSDQALPSALVVDDIETAARLVGGDWPERVEVGHARAALLRDRFPDHDDPAAILRATRRWSDVDVDLLCRTARWFAESHPAGLTARQVPVAGMGTKWLRGKEGVVRRLAGLDALDLVPGRPSRIHLTYLDRDHLAAGGRRHDVATVGDVETVAYQPSVVLISENRDTAQLFPVVEGGIAVEGDGNGPGGIPALEWVRACPTLVYWGDMDAKGLEILSDYRARGLRVRSLFMDMSSYLRWERFGVDHDHGEVPIVARPPKEGLALEPEELELYLALCSPTWTRHRRIEQERIPLEEAAAVVRARSEASRGEVDKIHSLRRGVINSEERPVSE